MPMSDVPPPATRRWTVLWCVVGTVSVAGAGVLGYSVVVPRPAAAPAAPAPPSMLPEPEEATFEQVHRLCAACHAYPPPDTFPRSAWRKEVKQGYDFFVKDPQYRFDYPPLEAVVRYYEKRAPEALPPAPRISAPHAPPFRFDRASQRTPKLTARQESPTSTSSGCSAATNRTSSSATPSVTRCSS